MDFRLTDDQATLIGGVRDFLAGTHGPEVLRALDQAPSPRSDAIWQGLVEMGLPGLLVPEEQGGLGMDLVTGAMLAVELGRAGVAEPIVDTAFVAVPWLAAHGETRVLTEIAVGRATVALAHPVNPWVADLDRASLVIGGGKVSAVPGSKPVPTVSVDPLRALFAGPTVDADDRLLDLAALMTAAQLVGIGDAMIAMSVDYAGNRNQFGQPIGAFQAIKHHLASAQVKLEFVRPVLMRAADAVQRALPSASVHVSHAKLAAGDAATAIAETAIQVHGAMGYTYEVDLHFWMKRAWALAGAWGDRAFHLRRIDAATIGRGLAVGPSHSFA